MPCQASLSIHGRQCGGDLVEAALTAQETLEEMTLDDAVEAVTGNMAVTPGLPFGLCLRST